ncbi:MAG: TonB-dependent receptor [Flavobacterium sp.]|nr:MAG: TonB-dependent receptor [Flavobacterium sp.]
MKKLVISILFAMQAVFAFAQTTAGISGKVVDSKTQKPLQNVVVSIQNTTFTQITDVMGMFRFDDLDAGMKLVQIKSTGYKDQLLPVNTEAGKVIDLGVVVLEEDITSEQELSLITITENDLGDDNSGSESTSGLLQASRDAFQQSAAFNWGQARFRIRGLDNEYGVTMINGITMNKIYDGRPQWGNWGGLNDATRNQEFTTGTAPSDYTFGGILGTQEINTRASIYRPGTRISFSGANTNYMWRTMATYASGMTKDGWAYVVSGGTRWAEEAFFEGTDYSATSLFASVEKKFSEHHSLGLTSVFAQNIRGKNSPNSKEVVDLAGYRYNSYWGWQDGEKRNSRVKRLEEPFVILTHYWKMNDKTNLNTSVGYQTGSIGNSRLDYNGGNNPDPTYYKNLPSYFLNMNDEDSTNPFYVPTWTPDLAQAIAAKDDFLANRQIDWGRMYRANAANHSAIYALYEDRTDDRLITGNMVFNSQLADNIVMNAGVTFRNLKSENFQNLLDNLGDYTLTDNDTFYVGAGFTDAQSQSDLNHPDRQVNVGERYGYNYIMRANTYDAFTQFKLNYRKFDFYIAQSFTRTDYQREGLYRNGLYQDNSYGLSDKINFENFGFKGGLTYKLNGSNLFTFNGAYMTKAPALKNAFINARLNNIIVDDLQSEAIVSGDASYILRMPKFKARVTGYYSKVKNSTKIGFFYAEGLAGIEGDDTNAGNDEFVAEITKGLDKQNIGGELGMEYQVTSTIKVTGSAAYGQYIYSNNPNVALSVDGRQAAGLNPVVNFGTSALKNYRQGGSPQQAYSVGIEYRDPKFWWVGVNGNYLADTYIDVDPLLRTNNFFQIPGYGGLSFPEATEERARVLLAQEKIDPFYLVNLTGGKSWKIHGKTLGFFASVNNVFDTVYQTGGFESARKANFREINMDHFSLDNNAPGAARSFGSRYFYGYGRTYFVNVYLQF